MGANTTELEAVVRSYFSALNGGNAEQVLATFADSIVLMLHGRPTVSGIDAAKASYEKNLSATSFQRVLHIDDASLDGNLGYVRCHSTGTVTPKATGTPKEVSGRELFVLERANDGWKIQTYMMNHLAP